MYRRKRNRVKMVLGVRLAGRGADGQPFDLLTCTLDISLNGVRLGGADRLQLQLGDIVELNRKHRKATFRVRWIGERGSKSTGHVGLEAIDAPPEFWGLDLPTTGEQPSMIPTTNPPSHVDAR
jgi:hypothetical protein